MSEDERRSDPTPVETTREAAPTSMERMTGSGEFRKGVDYFAPTADPMVVEPPMALAGPPPADVGGDASGAVAAGGAGESPGE